MIFISYRRSANAAAAGRLYDRLERAFQRQRLFMDVDSIAPGEDFISILQARVSRCQVLLALIGRGWLTASDDAGRRLDDPNDFVRIEIASALTQGKLVIPVLIDDVPMPRANELPEELKLLVRRQAVRLNHDHFRSDVAKLVRFLKQVVANHPAALVHPSPVEEEAPTETSEEQQRLGELQNQHPAIEADDGAEEEPRRTQEEGIRETSGQVEVDPPFPIPQR